MFQGFGANNNVKSPVFERQFMSVTDNKFDVWVFGTGKDDSCFVAVEAGNLAFFKGAGYFVC